MTGLVDLLGFLAGALTTVALAPQVVKAASGPSPGSGILLRSTSSIPGVVARGPRLGPIGEARHTRFAGDLSGWMFVAFGAGVFLWLIYGIAIGSLPVILANGATFVLAMAIVLVKHRFDCPR